MSRLLVLIFLLGYAFSTAQNESPPNIILIMADDLGYETIAANGGKSYQTPHIDQMAAEGIRFNHCYAQPLCTPTRIQLMTGIYNVRNYVQFGYLDTMETTFGHLFQEAGYATAVVGKWQLGKDPKSPNKAGFDEYCLWQVQKGRTDENGRDTRFSAPVLETNGDIRKYSSDEYGPDIVCDFGIEFIEKSHRSSKPFFLYYPMILTHCPFSPTPESDTWTRDLEAVNTYKGNPEYFGDMVSKMDELVGRIRSKVEALGIAENTLIIFTGDNGTDVPVVSQLVAREVAGAKGASTDAGTRVPLVASWPGRIKGGATSEILIDFTDFLPTICDAASIDIPKTLNLDGRSFLNELKGKPFHPRSWIYSWFSRSGDPSKARVFARTEKYKLYDSGEFYRIDQDYLENTPIDYSDLDSDQQVTHEKLQSVLDYYGAMRE